MAEVGGLGRKGREDNRTGGRTAEFKAIEGRRAKSRPEGSRRPRALRGLVGESGRFREVLDALPALAESDATVLIEGETGTGKDLCAKALHRLSGRSGRRFTPVNCSAIPRDLVENELFGHRRAAFTGAATSQVGLIQDADGGTLFFDEIDALPLSAQAKLLRFFQDGEYRPLGANRVSRADVRVLAASNSDLAAAVERGDFRRDLYYRLDVLRLTLPPLRERLEDVPLLAEHFLAIYAERFRSRARRFTDEAMESLLKHDWPGNVRELENVVERSVILARGRKAIGLRDFQRDGDAARLLEESFAEAKRRVVGEFERSYLRAYLAAFRGNIRQAASAAGKHRRAFWELMRKHSIDAGRFRDRDPGSDA